MPEDRKITIANTPETQKIFDLKTQVDLSHKEFKLTSEKLNRKRMRFQFLNSEFWAEVNEHTGTVGEPTRVNIKETTEEKIVIETFTPPPKQDQIILIILNTLRDMGLF